MYKVITNCDPCLIGIFFLRMVSYENLCVCCCFFYFFWYFVMGKTKMVLVPLNPHFPWTIWSKFFVKDVIQVSLCIADLTRYWYSMSFLVALSNTVKALWTIGVLEVWFHTSNTLSFLCVYWYIVGLMMWVGFASAVLTFSVLSMMI